MWIKRGGFLIVRAPPEAAASGARLAGEVERVLYEQEVSGLKGMAGVWPKEFEEEGEGEEGGRVNGRAGGAGATTAGGGAGGGGAGQGGSGGGGAGPSGGKKTSGGDAGAADSDSDDSGLPPLEENPNRRRQTYATSSSESDSEEEEEEPWPSSVLPAALLFSFSLLSLLFFCFLSSLFFSLSRALSRASLSFSLARTAALVSGSREAVPQAATCAVPGACWRSFAVVVLMERGKNVGFFSPSFRFFPSSLHSKKKKREKKKNSNPPWPPKQRSRSSKSACPASQSRPRSLSSFCPLRKAWPRGSWSRPRASPLSLERVLAAFGGCSCRRHRCCSFCRRRFSL